jgi:hypothetical protein
MNNVHMNLYLDLDTVLELVCIVTAFLALAGAGWAILGLRRVRARNDSLEGSLGAVQREFELAASIALRAGQSVKRLEAENNRLSDRLGLIELRGEARPYEQAIDSARRGADPAKLSQQFGLSRGEADLLSRLHGRKKTA